MTTADLLNLAAPVSLAAGFVPVYAWFRFIEIKESRS